MNLAKGLENAGYTVEKRLNDLYINYKAYWDARCRCNRDPEQRWYTAPPVEEPALDHAAIENLSKTADVAIITLGRQAGEGGFDAYITVTNSGRTAGKESVQLYVTAPEGKLEKPAMELKAFAKTNLLQPGESQTLKMSVSPYYLASFDPATQSWVTDKGRYEVKFAASAEDVRATVPFTVSTAGNWPVNDVLRPNKDK